MIRHATRDDIPDVIRLVAMEWGEESANTTGLRFSHGALATGVENLIDGGYANGECIVAEHKGQVIGVIITQYAFHLFNAKTPFACESAWFVLPDFRGGGAGKALLDAAESAARAKGVGIISLGSPVIPEYSERLLKKYKEWGYVPFETHSFKDLRGGGGS
jgi:GNAT superfamily N-acetyltransferase